MKVSSVRESSPISIVFNRRQLYRLSGLLSTPVTQINDINRWALALSSANPFGQIIIAETVNRCFPVSKGTAVA